MKMLLRKTTFDSSFGPSLPSLALIEGRKL